jgi:23S rRNA (pseudouridine1915-N3)-methyltransferase
MKLAFLFVGGQKEAWLEELTDSYRQKLQPFASTEVIRVKPSQLPREAAQRKLDEETSAILRHLRKDDYLIVCDERGLKLDSIQFSARWVRAFESGRARVVVVVGGAFGLGEEVRKRADFEVNLSPMVLSHVIAQAVILEQCYRAFAIWRRLPYHNE